MGWENLKGDFLINFLGFMLEGTACQEIVYFSCIFHLLKMLADYKENVPIIQNNMKQFINKKFSIIVEKDPDEVETNGFLILTLSSSF